MSEELGAIRGVRGVPDAKTRTVAEVAETLHVLAFGGERRKFQLTLGGGGYIQVTPAEARRLADMLTGSAPAGSDLDSSEGDERLASILKTACATFPGLVDGKGEVNGGDLVAFLTEALADCP